ncbi:MAG: hypothetical protein ACYTEQ_20425 [Planctomycetota bacterium]|jgi:hypothetical protein
MTGYGPHVIVKQSGVAIEHHMDAKEEAAWEADRQKRILAAETAERERLEDEIVALRGKVDLATAEGLTGAVARYQVRLEAARAELATLVASVE